MSPLYDLKTHAVSRTEEEGEKKKLHLRRNYYACSHKRQGRYHAAREPLVPKREGIVLVWVQEDEEQKTATRRFTHAVPPQQTYKRGGSNEVSQQ